MSDFFELQTSRSRRWRHGPNLNDSSDRTIMRTVRPCLHLPPPSGDLISGKSLYEITCLVCHGESGAGDGPVGLKFVTKAPVDLNEDYTQDQADGQLFFTITRGRALMPYYRDALNVEERWHVVNYVKQEFGN